MDAGLICNINTPLELNLWTTMYPIEKNKMIDLITRVLNDKSFLDIVAPMEEDTDQYYLAQLYKLGKDILQYNNDDNLLCKAMLNIIDQFLEITLSREIDGYRYIHIVELNDKTICFKIYF